MADVSRAEVIDLTSLSDSDAEPQDNSHVVDGPNGSDHDSEGSEIEITLNEETRAQLQTAIATISEERLRRLLNHLVETEITIEAVLTRELVTLMRETHDIVPRWEICGHCHEEYDINIVHKISVCIFHPGELEVSEDAFADWDEDVHGPMDSNQNRRQYPENFIWSCCENDGTSEGCVQGEHRPATSRKRKRA